MVNGGCAHFAGLLFVPQKRRGLGLTPLTAMNDALLVKLAWRVLKEPHSLCSRVLGSKYGRWHSIAHGSAPSQASIIWRDILSVQRQLWQGARWRVAIGEDILFWKDRWLRDVPLSAVVVAQPPASVATLYVRDFWSDTSGWDFAQLQNWLSPDILHELWQLSLLEAGSLERDILYWEPGVNGLFSAAAVLFLLSASQQLPHMDLWRRLWVFKGPRRASMTLWAIAWDILPTRNFLCRRRIVMDSVCCWCSGSFWFPRLAGCCFVPPRLTSNGSQRIFGACPTGLTGPFIGIMFFDKQYTNYGFIILVDITVISRSTARMVWQSGVSKLFWEP